MIYAQVDSLKIVTCLRLASLTFSSVFYLTRCFTFCCQLHSEHVQAVSNDIYTLTDLDSLCLQVITIFSSVQYRLINRVFWPLHFSYPFLKFYCPRNLASIFDFVFKSSSFRNGAIISRIYISVLPKLRAFRSAQLWELQDTLVRSEPLNSGPRNLTPKKLKESLYRTVLIYYQMIISFCHMYAFDRQTDKVHSKSSL